MYQRKASVLQCSAFFIVQPQLSYPFICRQRSRLLPCPGYSKQCCNEHCFLVFVINSVPLRTQSSVPILLGSEITGLTTLPLWTLLFLYQVASVSSLPPLFSAQLCESLCVPDSGEHLGNWLLAGSVSLLLIPPFYSPGHLCLLPPSSLYNSVNISEQSSCGMHIRKWLLASLLSPLLIPPHLIWVTSNSLLPLLFSV